MASYSVQYIFTLVDRFSAGGALMAATARKIHTAMAAAGAAMGTLAKRAALAAAAVGVLGAAFLLKGVKKAAEFENAMANVRRVTDISRAEMLDYGKAALKAGVATGQSGVEFANMMAQGAMMGLRGKETLVSFADTVSQVAVAWDDISKEVAASQMARLSAKFFGDQAPAQQAKSIRDVADAINELSNRSAFKAPEMLKFFDRGAAAAQRFGLSAQQAAAYGGAALVLGEPTGELQGTRARMTFQRLLKAATDPVRGKKGPTKLGTAFDTLGLTQDQFRGMMEKSPQGAILELMERMQGMDKFTQQRVADGFLDAKSSAQFLSIVQSLNEYKRQLAIADDEWAGRFANDPAFMNWLQNAGEGHRELYDQLVKYGRIASRVGSVQREFAKRTETLEFAWSQLGKAIDRVQILASMPLLEPLRKFSNVLTDAAMAAGDFMENNKGLTDSIMNGAGVAAIIAAGSALMSLGVYLTGASSKAALLGGLMKGLFKFTVGALVIAGLIELVANFDAVKAAAQEAAAVVKSLWGDGKAETGEGSNYYNLNKMLENTAFGRAVIGMGMVKPIDQILAEQRSITPYDNIVNMDAYNKAQAASDEARRTYTPFQQMQGYTPPPQSWRNFAFSAHDDAWGNGSSFGPQGNPAFNAAQIPQAMAINTTVTSHTSFDPATITVNVTGQVNAPLNGTGSGTLQARPSRGEATSSAGASSPAYDNPGGGAP